MVAGGSSHAPDREYLQLFTATHCTVSKSAASHNDTPLDLRNKDFRLLRSKLTRLFTKKKVYQKLSSGFLKMPRSFLVKKHINSTKKPNYSELESPTVFITPHFYKGLPLSVIPQSEILSPAAYSPITVWTTSNLPLSPLPNDLSPISGYPSSLSDTSSKDHSGSESPRSDEDERMLPKLTDPHGVEAEKFQCSLCSKSYSTYSGLLKHKQLHCDAQTRKSFSCKYCEKEYVSLGALKMHIRTHTLPCVCKICGKAFSRPWLLQGHIRTHTGEKPFSCPHCNRAFADRSNLRAHLQTHSDVKKYQCKNCSKTFSRMSLLHKHEESGCCVAH
ncbi:zinc finger protein SNAI2 [Acanthochromis polyacanthus]|uniref:Zinc finger protein SNAI2 n=1 Tax=Acanthochromis polyacanthus TaxID=80966 RepID=A0A3Q1F565_9TELE|nr:zinc finger protein SNAI2 [Acanthochromis polyacanthus]